MSFYLIASFRLRRKDADPQNDHVVSFFFFVAVHVCTIARNTRVLSFCLMCVYLYMCHPLQGSYRRLNVTRKGEQEQGSNLGSLVSNLRLLLLLGLEVLVTEVGSETTDQDDTVQTDTEAGGVVVGGGGGGGRGLSLGGRVAGLTSRLVRCRNGATST